MTRLLRSPWLLGPLLAPLLVPAGCGDEDAGPAEVAGCEGATLLAADPDASVPGPWPVGSRTVSVAGLTAEVWYPAAPGSEAGAAARVYDVREQLPPEEAAKIAEDADTRQICACFEGLPIDADHGPYPGIVFVHGTAGFRTQSLSHNVHWASRGFVVISADHPGIVLGDLLFGSDAEPDQAGEARSLLDALSAPAGELAFLEGHVDPARLGASGHSAGGGAISGLGDLAAVLVPMAAGGTQDGPALRSSLILGGDADMIVPPSSQQGGYDSSPGRRRLAILEGAGHLAFSDICEIGAADGGLLQIAMDAGVPISPLIITLAQDGCGDEYLPTEEAHAIIHGASAAVFEETLHCREERTGFLAGFADAFPAVGTYEESLD